MIWLKLIGSDGAKILHVSSEADAQSAYRHLAAKYSYLDVRLVKVGKRQFNIVVEGRRALDKTPSPLPA